MRLTLLYGALFLLSGAGLLATTYVLFEHAAARAGAAASTGSTAVPRFTAGGDDSGRGARTDRGQPSQPRQADPQLRQSASEAVRQRAEQMHQLLIQSGISLGMMSLVSIGLGWLVAGRVLRPIRTITATAREISATNLHRRLTLRGPDDELKELSDTFDDLLGRLDTSFESQRRFIVNASHELRTPLALQRTLLQLALSDPHPTPESVRLAHENVLDATYQQERMIDALLTLARGEQGLSSRNPTDLAELAHEALLARTGEAARRGVRLVSTLLPARTVGNQQLLERLVANLVDNAIRYNAPSGEVWVSTATAPAGAFLSVANTGPAVAADQVDQLFEPFHRLDADRLRHDGGLGMGLSIVNRATSRARPRPGGGLDMTVTFPVSGTRPNPECRRIR
jgi:signal transduction histidine kinase